MAKIADSKGRSDNNSGYVRLFGNVRLGRLMSRVQATVNRTGNELERIIEGYAPPELKSTLEAVLTGQNNLFDMQIVFHPKMPSSILEHGAKADIVIIDHVKRLASIIELKDGDTFDTKKASGEFDSMTKFAEWIAEQTGYKASIFFCSFNQDNKDAIVKGSKGRFEKRHAMTGRELCKLLRIDYDVLREERENEQPENLRYFLKELIRIPEVRWILDELWDKEK